MGCVWWWWLSLVQLLIGSGPWPADFSSREGAAFRPGWMEEAPVDWLSGFLLQFWFDAVVAKKWWGRKKRETREREGARVTMRITGVPSLTGIDSVMDQRDDKREEVCQGWDWEGAFR